MPKIHTETKIKEKEQEKIFCVFFFFFLPKLGFTAQSISALFHFNAMF